MEELRELKENLNTQRPAPWEAMPDIALYMDQVISYLPRQLIRYGETDTLTSAMVNNYIKDGLLPRAEGKRYNRTHLAYLTAICALKQVLSVKEMKTLLQSGSLGQEPEKVYDYFCRELDSALMETERELDCELEREELPKLALAFALRSYTDKLACERILTLLQDQAEPDEEKKQSKNKEKTRNKEKSE